MARRSLRGGLPWAVATVSAINSTPPARETAGRGSIAVSSQQGDLVGGRGTLSTPCRPATSSVDENWSRFGRDWSLPHSVDRYRRPRVPTAQAKAGRIPPRPHCESRGSRG